MKYEQWEGILSAIDTDLSKDNVIQKIKEGLKVEDKDEYKKWEKANFDVNHQFAEEGMSKSTLLHLAARHEAASVVSALLGVEEINVNAVDKDGRIPLHWAAVVSVKGIVEILIEGGADVKAVDKNGKTPRDLARYDYMKEFLKEAEEKQLREQNEGTSNLPQSNTDKYNKDTTRLLGKTEPTSAITKGVIAGGATALLGTAVAVAPFATGAIAVELVPVLVAVVTVTVAALAVGGITYIMLKPSTKMDETQVNGDMPKVPSY